jgi:hypothetical protein
MRHHESQQSPAPQAKAWKSGASAPRKAFAPKRASAPVVALFFNLRNQSTMIEAN